jgi:exodeoxyribonuclease VII small subunit
MTERNSKPMSLEARLARLEEIVGSLEGEHLELEEALRLFEEGIAHLRVSQGVLRDAELRIERLLEEADGSVTLESMGWSEE